MQIWVTPAEAWHFYWDSLTSLHLLSPCKVLLSRNRSWGIFWFPVPGCWCCHFTLRQKLRCRVAAGNDDTISSPAFALWGGLWHTSHPQPGIVLRGALQTDACLSPIGSQQQSGSEFQRH